MQPQTSSALPLLPDLVLNGQPFTRSEGRDHDLDAKQIRRLLRIGLLRSVVRGVYVDALVEDSLALRAAAIAKVAPPDAVACRQTAAWLLGVDTLALSEHADTPKVDFVRQAKTRAVKISRASGHSQTLLAGDVIDWHGLQITSPLATAVHLARHLRRPFALSALDAMARAGLATRLDVQDAIRRFPHHPGIVQARELAALIDPGAESPGESWLRLWMIDAGFPPPVPQIEITDEVNSYRIDLGFLDPIPGTADRHLGLEYDSDKWHGTAEQRRHDSVRRTRLGRLGWDVLSVGRWQVWGRDTTLEESVGKILGLVPRSRRW
ncbi:hypothetical protein [Streptomyces sp. SID13031]|uniref:hypothetical protein n=1 Tax=Streptomyces sp. SID13031 TaxID=2706046 RepID=UPI0013C73562|nr:hypothetical protein [Streptomyces sp. SID13031]NEA34472.1 hypothetical protein [Streptomyces sp. SID13031]